MDQAKEAVNSSRDLMVLLAVNISRVFQHAYSFVLIEHYLLHGRWMAALLMLSSFLLLYLVLSASTAIDDFLT